jgi:hypothetical protein
VKPSYTCTNFRPRPSECPSSPISERSQSRLTWSRACAPCTCLAHFGRTCTGLDRGVSGDPVRGGRAELLVLCGGRDEQQASQPPIWRDGNRTCFFFFARSSQSLFYFFLSTHCRHQVQTRRQSSTSSGKKTQSRAPSRTRRRADQGHTQGVAPSSIPLGRDLVVWLRSTNPRRK